MSRARRAAHDYGPCIAGTEFDRTKLKMIAANFVDFGASLKDRHTLADIALRKEIGAAFRGIAKAIDELAAPRTSLLHHLRTD